MVNRLNLHIDESGSQDFSEGRYIVAVVLHDHSANIADPIDRYECRLSIAGLPNIPFHGKDLLHGNQDYAAVSPGDRKRLLAQFARFVRELPFSFFVLRYGVSDARNREELEARIRRDLALFVFDRLPYFQLFDVIAVYYDNGQGAVSIALRDALDFALAKNVADYRDADHSARRLLQVADYICTVVRVSDDYDAGKQTKTHERFFGNRRSFMQSFKNSLIGSCSTEWHAWNRAPACVMPDDCFLVAFYENALGFAENNLSREDLNARPFSRIPICCAMSTRRDA